MDADGWYIAAVAAPAAVLLAPRVVSDVVSACSWLTRAVTRAAGAVTRAARPRVVAAALGLGAAATTTLASPVSAASPASPASPASAPAAAPALGRPAEPARPPVRSADAVHVVRPGESLWSIARDHLGASTTDADVATDWPRWYRANRAVIGHDPSLLRVGVVLRVPSPAAPGVTAHRSSSSSTRTTGRRTGTSAAPRSAEPTPARTVAHPTVEADSLDPDRR